MKRKTYINWLILCVSVCTAVASKNDESPVNIQNVKREIELTQLTNANGEARVLSAAAINALENGIGGVRSSVCSTDLKLFMNGLTTRQPWTLSSEFICYSPFLFETRLCLC